MDYIELLQANKKSYKIKFINTLKDVSCHTSKELANFYDCLLESKRVIIKFKPMNTDCLNNIAINIMELDISLGDSSFHEEKH